ncbi:MAG: tRNA (adenosine(37)-N6)-threonylcarbamoyltransferase complex ATPase subunit type 1 TsaE [Phycisphaeraceae bacterium]|nr:tRNA (adenosine(37)-N6)-threonylcarbamoyltransferase complex ATPase subunit type 1 TsaE [Phycisphaeraceae bacterium]MCB9848847.1 tRNA (adenosine(37)-N6)-threonylcarbamoyltransferase complex ATPase subunit type 1 TsaE [Phycisphaeraceae bacterium]
MSERIVTTTEESRTHALGVALGAVLRPGDVVELIGELGAGKTRLVRGIAQGAGHNPDEVSSPTYVLFNEYRRPDAAPILHIDAYRIADADELIDAGYDHASRGAIVLIEWADRIAGAVEGERLRIEIEHAPGDGETCRVLRIDCPAGLEPRLAPALDGAPSAEPRAKSSPCPICKAPTDMNAPTAPFCSARCRMVDLGKWMREDYVISRELKETDLDELE